MSLYRNALANLKSTAKQMVVPSAQVLHVVVALVMPTVEVEVELGHGHDSVATAPGTTATRLAEARPDDEKPEQEFALVPEHGDLQTFSIILDGSFKGKDIKPGKWTLIITKDEYNEAKVNGFLIDPQGRYKAVTIFQPHRLYSDRPSARRAMAMNRWPIPSGILTRRTVKELDEIDIKLRESAFAEGGTRGWYNCRQNEVCHHAMRELGDGNPIVGPRERVNRFVDRMTGITTQWSKEFCPYPVRSYSKQPSCDLLTWDRRGYIETLEPARQLDLLHVLQQALNDDDNGALAWTSEDALCRLVKSKAANVRLETVKSLEIALKHEVERLHRSKVVAGRQPLGRRYVDKVFGVLRETRDFDEDIRVREAAAIALRVLPNPYVSNMTISTIQRGSVLLTTFALVTLLIVVYSLRAVQQFVRHILQTLR